MPILQSDFITSHLQTITPHQPIAILLAHPYSDITTLIHCTIPAHRYPTCPSSNPISSLRFIALYQPVTTPLAHPPIQFITSIHQPIAIPLTHPSIRYHHFDSLHYISPPRYAVHTLENLYCPDRVLCRCSRHLIPSSTLGHKAPLGALAEVLG